MNAKLPMLAKLKTVLSISIEMGISFRKIFRVYSAYITYFTTLVVIGSYFSLIAMNSSQNYTNFTFAAIFLIEIN
jgi:hypothetical protein